LDLVFGFDPKKNRYILGIAEYNAPSYNE